MKSVVPHGCNMLKHAWRFGPWQALVALVDPMLVQDVQAWWEGRAEEPLEVKSRPLVRRGMRPPQEVKLRPSSEGDPEGDPPKGR